MCSSVALEHGTREGFGLIDLDGTQDGLDRMEKFFAVMDRFSLRWLVLMDRGKVFTNSTIIIIIVLVP
jgi:hypothetical protein